MKKSVFEKWTSKAAGMIEKMSERNACAGYCNTESGLLFTDADGHCLYMLEGVNVAREDMPRENTRTGRLCSEMTGLSDIMRGALESATDKPERIQPGTVDGGKKAVVCTRLFCDGQ